MNWAEQLVENLKSLNAEVVRDGRRLVVTCPKEFDRQHKATLCKSVPSDFELEFVEGMKQSTTHHLQQLLQRTVMMGSAQPEFTSRDLTIHINGQLREEPDWQELDEILAKDGYPEKWAVKINGQEAHSNSGQKIEALQKVADNLARRDQILTDDDVLNVRISLANVETVEDFINSI